MVYGIHMAYLHGVLQQHVCHVSFCFFSSTESWKKSKLFDNGDPFHLLGFHLFLLDHRSLLFFSPFRSSRKSLHVQDDDARVERAQRERLAEERRGETQKDRPVWSIVISKLCDSFRNIYLSFKVSKHKERLSLSQNFWANFSHLPYIILLKLLKSIPTVKSIWKSEM